MATLPVDSAAPDDARAASHGAAFRVFALVVLLAANVLNYADRSLLSALAQPLRGELGIGDAQLGFLAGTSFVVFNAVVGIAMARVGDRWRRNRLLMLGVAFWSAMTVISGFTISYGQLVAARIGVGVGEATIGAIGYSMLADIFPARQRAFVFALFLCGPFLGLGFSLSFGGWLVDHWADHCTAFGLCGLAGWRAAFVIFGAPGVIVAILAAFLGEPDPARRGGAQGARPGPLAEGLRELSLLVPPFAFFQAWRLGGRRSALANLVIAAVLAAAGALLIRLTGSIAQWTAVAIAAYGLISWARAQAHTDPDLYRLTVGSRAFLAAILGAALLASIHGAMSFWAMPLAIRKFGLSAAEAGALLGPAVGGGSLAGTLLGGWITDRWRRVNPAAPLYMCLIAAVGGAALLGVVLKAPSVGAMVPLLALILALLASWPPAITALVQDLVGPAMRARAAALYVVITTLIGGSLGPYTVGRLADAPGSVATGLSCLLVLPPIAVVLFVVSMRSLAGAYAERGRTVGSAPPAATAVLR